uniref:CCZ1/INTU/HSP4 first Longin domain-containing protein n=1 Tax=Setaria digitata TaxID=48799 RepID=A0A915PS22_9BILA
MNPSTFSGNFVLSSPSASRSKGNSCHFIDIFDFIFVAHPDSGRIEGEESERVFYFNSPQNESAEKQTQITGFAEAVVNFTENFTEEKDETEFHYRYVNTSKQLHVYIEVESGKFILGAGINKELAISEDYILRGSAVKEVLITAYKMFRLFFGPFSRLASGNPAHLKDRLEYFFSRYLPQLRLHRMPLLDVFCGVDYLSLDSTSYLRIENLLDDLTENFPQISKTVFFYQERLITYSVSKADLPVLYRYLTQNLLSRSLKEELQPERSSRKDSIHRGKFLTGSVASIKNPLTNDSYNAKLPVVYLCDDNNGRRLAPYEMIAYRALNATICLFIQKSVDLGFLQRLDNYLGPELTALASRVAESYAALNDVSKKESEFHFVYFNPESMSLKTSLAENIDSSRSTNLPSVPSSVYKSACDMFDEFLEGNDFGETSAKLDADWWLIIKKINKRFLLLILRSATLSAPAEVQQYVNDIIKINFDTVFLF